MAVIDMQTMRYINLLDKVSHVKTRQCFDHNNTVFFAVNRRDVSKAIGAGASNVKRIQDSLGKKVKIIKEAEGIRDVKRFVEDIIEPVRMKSLEIKDSCVIVTAGSNQNKASLIGRNKRRYEELKQIIKDTFNLDLKIL